MKILYPILTVVILPLTALGQTGPAGVLSNTNNVFWLKADADVYTNAGTTLATNGQTVEQWNDKSGNGKDFIQSSLTSKPLLTASSLNGLPAITFDGSDDYLANLSIATANRADFFAVIKYATVITGNPGIFQGAAAGQLLATIGTRKSVGMWVNSSNQPWGRGVQSNGTARDISTVNSISSGAGQILENRYAGSINQYINSTASGSSSTNGTLRSWTEFAIGGQGNEFWNGDIAEIIGFNTSLGLAQRNIISNYLSAKYDVPINAANEFYNGDVSANGDYDFEVAGIGQESDGSNSQFSPSICGGFGITYVSGFNNGEYILAGHNLSSRNEAISTDVGGMTGPGNQRWKRIWYIDVTGSVTTDVSFDMSDGGMRSIELANSSNYVLLTRAGTSGNWTETSYSASISGDVINFSNVSLADGYYTIGTRNNQMSPIPVKLVRFSAQKTTNNFIELTWQTATENNNSFFTIEHSADGKTWKQVETMSGAGNSTAVRTYFYTDKSPVAGLNHYRLRQTDFDGNYSLSPVRVVNMDLTIQNKLIVYPNPATNRIFIQADREMLTDLTISNVSGKHFRGIVMNGIYANQQLQIDIGSLSPGLYFINAGGKTTSFLKE